MTLDERQIGEFVSMAWNWATIFLPRLGAAIAILAVGLLVARWLSRLVLRVLSRTPHVDPR